MWKRYLLHVFGFTLGITPGVLYAVYGMVGIGAAAFLMILGGSVGVALTLRSVSAYRVFHTTAGVTPLFPLLLFLPDPHSDPLPPPAIPVPPPLPVEPAADLGWLTTNVLCLARTVRQNGSTHLLPILADALEESGCVDGDLIRQCRDGKECEQILNRLIGPVPMSETETSPETTS